MADKRSAKPASAGLALPTTRAKILLSRALWQGHKDLNLN